VSVPIERHMLRAGVRYPDARRIGAGPHDEVVFDQAAAPVVVEVDAGIDAGAMDTAIGVNPGAPPLRVPADEVVDHSRQRVAAGDPGVRRAVCQPHPNDHRFWALSDSRGSEPLAGTLYTFRAEKRRGAAPRPWF